MAAVSVKNIERGVLVVGGGPTGLTMACELARRKVDFRVIDKSAAASDKSKALAVHARSLEAFDDIGVLQEALATGIPAHGMEIFVRDQRLCGFNFDELDSRYKFILMLPQNETEAILGRRLAALGHQVEYNVELTDFTQDRDGVTVALRHLDGRQEQGRFQWLVGCDGAHSTVRHVLGLPFSGAEYPELFSLADVHVQWNHSGDKVIAYLAETGPMIFFPMRGGRYRVIAITPQADPTQEPSLEEFQALVDQHGLAGTKLTDPHWLTRFHIHRRRVPAYRAGRTFVAGDAGHIHSPAGGQGMNTGMQDSYNLAWKLALVASGAGRPEILDSYQAERHPVAADVLKSSDLLTRLGLATNPLAQSVVRHLVPLLMAQEAVVHALTRQMSGVGVNYSHSPIVGQDSGGLLAAVATAMAGQPPDGLDFRLGPRPGAHAPDVEGLLDGSGATVRLYDVLRGIEHHLLLFAGLTPDADPFAQLAEVIRAVRQRCGAHVVTRIVVPARLDKAPPGIDVLRDPHDQLHAAYHASFPSLYLLRPDHYVGYRAQPPQAQPLLDYLNVIFTFPD